MPRLLTVSGNSIDLEPGVTYTLGRDKTCDIVVEDCACSRHHARITVDTAHRVFLEDLGSRNGTWLDADRVADVREVPDGAKVKIGSTVFAVLTGADEIELDETCVMYSDTIVIERLPPSAVAKAESSSFAGDLSAMSVVDVLQVLHQMGRSGELRLRLAAGVARVWFACGEVVDAAWQDRVGADALAEVAGETEGRFDFVEAAPRAERRIECTTRELLFELCRLLDESTRLEESAELEELEG